MADVTAPGVTAPGGEAPPVRRRLACLAYEGVLLFGVVVVAALPYSILTGQRHALQGRHGLQALLLAVTAAYFVWFWSHGGQTLAMKTWRIRVERVDGGPISMSRALARYLLSWLWFAPALVTIWLSGEHGGGFALAMLAAGMLAFAALSRLRPDRQFWHDAVCGTRLVRWRDGGTPQARAGEGGVQ